MEIELSSHGLFNLGLAHLALNQADAARAVYRQAIEQFGREEGIAIGAVEDLVHLVKNSTQPKAARQILNTYWPGQLAGHRGFTDENGQSTF